MGPGDKQPIGELDVADGVDILRTPHGRARAQVKHPCLAIVAATHHFDVVHLHRQNAAIVPTELVRDPVRAQVKYTQCAVVVAHDEQMGWGVLVVDAGRCFCANLKLV